VRLHEVEKHCLRPTSVAQLIAQKTAVRVDRGSTPSNETFSLLRITTSSFFLYLQFHCKKYLCNLRIWIKIYYHYYYQTLWAKKAMIKCQKWSFLFKLALICFRWRKADIFNHPNELTHQEQEERFHGKWNFLFSLTNQIYSFWLLPISRFSSNFLPSNWIPLWIN